MLVVTSHESVSSKSYFPLVVLYHKEVSVDKLRDEGDANDITRLFFSDGRNY